LLEVLAPLGADLDVADQLEEEDDVAAADEDGGEQAELGALGPQGEHWQEQEEEEVAAVDGGGVVLVQTAEGQEELHPVGEEEGQEQVDGGDQQGQQGGQEVRLVSFTQIDRCLETSDNIHPHLVSHLELLCMMMHSRLEEELGPGDGGDHHQPVVKPRPGEEGGEEGGAEGEGGGAEWGQEGEGGGEYGGRGVPRGGRTEPLPPWVPLLPSPSKR
jgi:hypothetical protein